jgi:hypothetical protein
MWWKWNSIKKFGGSDSDDTDEEGSDDMEVFDKRFENDTWVDGFFFFFW